MPKWIARHDQDALLEAEAGVMSSVEVDRVADSGRTPSRPASGDA